MEYHEKTKDELIQEILNLNELNHNLITSHLKEIANCKQAEIALAESRDLLTNLAYLVPGVIYQYRLYPDGHSTFPYSSPGMNDIFEFTPEEVYNDAALIFERIHPEDHDDVVEAIQLSARTLRIFYSEFRVILPMQGLAWRWSQAVPERLPDGGTLWHGVILDNTDRKHTEERLRETISELKKSQRIAHVSNWKLDLETNLLTASEEGYRIFGFPLGSQLTFKQISDCIHPEDFYRVSETLQNALLNRENYTVEFQIINKATGLVKNILSIGEIQCDETGEPTFIIGTNQDITDLKQAEKVLRESTAIIEREQREKEAIINSTKDLIWSVDKNLKLITANEAFFTNTIKSWGSTPKYGDTILTDDIFSPGLLEKWTALYNEALTGKNIRRTIHTNDFRESGPTWLEITLNPIYHESKIIAIACFASNITEKKKMLDDLIKAKEKAEETDQLKTAFLNNISHEIRTPFNGMLGFLQMLEHEDLTSSERIDYINIFNSNAHRFMNTINNIVEISQIQAGQIGFTTTETNIRQQSLELFNHFNIVAEQKGLAFTVNDNLDLQTEYILTDGSKLKTILSILLDNAFKFTRTGSITFSINKNDKSIKYIIRDTGIGIPEDKMPTIFEQFSQVDLSNTRHFEGLGLGLSIAKAYAEMMGGSIWAESEEGKGTTFHFTIPCKNIPPNPIHPQFETSNDNSLAKGKPINILIAEDEEELAKLLTLILGKIANHIVVVGTGLEAVEVCRTNPDINIVLMDIKMPEMDGLEATRQIRQFNKELIIIAQTAYAMTGDHEKALAAGCNDYIAKPIRHETLKHMLQKYFN